MESLELEGFPSLLEFRPPAHGRFVRIQSVTSDGAHSLLHLRQPKSPADNGTSGLAGSLAQARHNIEICSGLVAPA